MIGDPRGGVKDFALVLSDDRREVVGQRLLSFFIEEESNRYAQSVRNFFKRADRGGSHSPFDLADETGRHSYFLRKLFQGHPAVLSHLSDLRTDRLHLSLNRRPTL